MLQSVWSDYPLVRVLLGLALIIFAFRFLFKRIFRFPAKPKEFQIVSSVALILVLLALFFSGMRASFGTFPVQIDDANISDNAKLNLIPVNGVFALKEALSVATIQNKLKEFDEEIEAIMYTDPVKSYRDYFGEQTDTTYMNRFFSVTDTNSFVEKHPPNVVFS